MAALSKRVRDELELEKRRTVPMCATMRDPDGHGKGADTLFLASPAERDEYVTHGTAEQIAPSFGGVAK